MIWAGEVEMINDMLEDTMAMINDMGFPVTVRWGIGDDLILEQNEITEMSTPGKTAIVVMTPEMARDVIKRMETVLEEHG